MEQHIFLSKADQRKFVLDRRRSMTGPELSGKSHAICARLLALPQLQNAGLILSYMPTCDEADVSELNRRLADRIHQSPRGVMEMFFELEGELTYA